MAYAAVASLSQTIHLILNYHQHSISPQFKNQIRSVHEPIIFLLSFLEDFPDEAKTFEERMREVTNEAEDIIELLLSDSLLEWGDGSSKSKFKRVNFDELERVTEEIESITKAVKERDKVFVGGYNVDLNEIILRLQGGLSVLEIILIVGIGGIGKTTLARTAFHHPLIVKHFDICAWVTVSRNYSWQRVIPDLLNSMNKLNAKSILHSDDELFTRVYHMLWGKRYLIVVDDLWSVEVWDQLESKIPHNFNGSRVLITTRLLDVASRVGSYGGIHEMCVMNVDQKSWILLRLKIFKGGPCPPNLKYMGKMNARSCRGLPLAIDVISGILAADKTEAAWEDIAENVKTNAINSEDDEYLLQLLHVSYTYLPHHLRPCYLYLGIFPEDHEIRVSKLIKLWVVEGFLNQSGCTSFEETGEEYLEELVKRGLVSVSKRKFNGRIKSVTVHDLMREMCIKQARVDNFFLHFTRFFPLVQAIQVPRRVSISNCDASLNKVNGSTIRTIICLEGIHEGIACRLEHSRLVRILDLSHRYGLHFLPDQVFELFHLRYLAFNFPFSIPKAILNLQNLQNLIICPKDREMFVMPVEIWRMRQLRHLVVHTCVLPSQEDAKFALENLETLTEVVDFICSRETLGMIPNLKKLGILYTVCGDYHLHNLIYLQKLEILKIETLNFPMEQCRISPAFPTTLKKLNLCGLRLPWEDIDIVSWLPNLEVLKLRNHACIGRTWETIEGGFPQLKFLLIDKSYVERWITKSCRFPRLKCLVLHHCWDLRKLPNEVGECPTLELIEVGDCHWSLLDSLSQIQGDRQNLGNDSLQVRLV